MTNRQELYSALREFFKTQELVCPHTYAKFGESSWDFLRTEYLETVLFLRRDLFKRSMTCNNYHTGGVYTQRGNRCNLCQLVKEKTESDAIYLTAHNDCGGDFDVYKMKSEDARQMIRLAWEQLPYPVRIEKGVEWLHVDTSFYGSSKKVNEFNA